MQHSLIYQTHWVLGNRYIQNMAKYVYHFTKHSLHYTAGDPVFPAMEHSGLNWIYIYLQSLLERELLLASGDNPEPEVPVV